MSVMHLSLAAGGKIWRLPLASRQVAPPAWRRLPVQVPGIIGVAFEAGRAVPVLAPGEQAGELWALCEFPQGVAYVTGETILPDAPGDPPALVLPAQPALLPRANMSDAAPDPARIAPKATDAPPAQTGLKLEAGHDTLFLPLDAVEHLFAMEPGTVPWQRMPVEVQGALGLMLAGGSPALILDPAWLMRREEALSASMVVIFRHGAGRYGLPCRRAAPASLEESGSLLLDRLDLPAGEALRSLAPSALDTVPPRPVPMTELLFFRLAGERLAVSIDAIQAVIPQTLPVAAPGHRAVVAHRGIVLPVIDGGLCLGREALLTAAVPLPLLRLSGVRPQALLVQQVEGLRRLPQADVAAIPGASETSLFSAMASLGNAIVPVLSLPGLLERAQGKA
ncbi:chemotaxis protein CheW [Acetobacteraceae bacterium H6797]|nr:chemotaxis protein CheW [Acetobacteraceae bacterium H6797]